MLYELIHYSAVIGVLVAECVRIECYGNCRIRLNGVPGTLWAIYLAVQIIIDDHRNRVVRGGGVSVLQLTQLDAFILNSLSS
jgi:hypothetical protein